MNRGGFSIVEIVITVTVLAILLTLGVVSMNAAQVNARDAERKADMESLAMIFEEYRKNPATGQDGYRDFSGYTYPDAVTIDTTNYFNNVFADIDPSIVRAPGVGRHSPMSLKSHYSAPQPSLTEYSYESLNENDEPCYDFIINGACTKFNLYYRLEKDNSIQKIMSKNQ